LKSTVYTLVVIPATQTPHVHTHSLHDALPIWIPLEADHVSDVRFIPNPYWVPELKPLRGTDAAVSDYVLGDANAEEFVGRYLEMITPVLRGYSAENKHFTTLAIGCTGGKHRSVAVAEKIGDELRRTGNAVRIRHRDLGRE